jgi:hypothetical protein
MILSTLNNGETTPAAPTYGYMEGTSQAEKYDWAPVSPVAPTTTTLRQLPGVDLRASIASLPAVSAPGGDDRAGDMILSTLNNGETTPAAPTYGYMAPVSPVAPTTTTLRQLPGVDLRTSIASLPAATTTVDPRETWRPVVLLELRFGR